MLRYHLFFVTFIVSLIIIPTFGDAENFFFSLGGIYAVSHIERSVINGTELNINFDDGLGVSLNFGYLLTDYFAFGIEIEGLDGFKWDLAETVPLTYYEKYSSNYENLKEISDARAELSFLTGFGFAKLSLPGEFRPYISGGIGIISQKYNIYYSGSIRDEEIEDFVLSESNFKSDNELCLKCGIGIDIQPIEEASVGLEGSYTTGLGDMDDISYTNIKLCFSLYF